MTTNQIIYFLMTFNLGWVTFSYWRLSCKYEELLDLVCRYEKKMTCLEDRLGDLSRLKESTHNDLFEQGIK